MDAISFYTREAVPRWRVTSPYGPRTHPISGKPSHHNGTDLIPLVDNRKIPIVWPYQITGEVIATRTMGGRGKTATIRPHGTNELILMQHLDSYLVKPGDRVNYGDPVGVCGTTGDSTGIHLHFEVKKWDGTDNGGAVWGNPANYQPVQAAPSTKFKPGDLIRSTVDMNIREVPSTQGAIAGRLTAGKEVRITASDYNGTYGFGYHWWRIQEGWVAERWLELIPEAPAEPEPEVKPEINPETIKEIAQAIEQIAKTIKAAAEDLEPLIEKLNEEATKK